MKLDNIHIIKANGERELFDVVKLKRSLKRAGANNEVINEIAEKIKGELKEGVHTKDIYKKAFSYLAKKSKVQAGKYSVRKAVMDLGPNGFPFEDFIGEIYRAKGYHVNVGETLPGACVMHELDVVAESDTDFLAAEIKFHNSPGIKSDLKTALYVKARFNDLEEGDYYSKLSKTKTRRNMLITNTKFTSKAIKYGSCAGLTLIGWNYPKKGNLQDLIEETGLHPLTCLTTLGKKQKNEFLKQGIVLCRDIRGGGKNILKTVGVNNVRAEEILAEVEDLCV